MTIQKRNIELLFGRPIAVICFSHVRTLDPETADLARELIDASDVQRSAFSSFVNLWMGFNGWMECVTDAATDAEMITALANHQRLTEAYNELVRNSPDFREKVEAFRDDVAGTQCPRCAPKTRARRILAIFS